jgi:hypothetical protein
VKEKVKGKERKEHERRDNTIKRQEETRGIKRGERKEMGDSNIE